MLNIFKYLNFWLIFGFTAQFIFFLRVMVQWIHSEKAKKSVIPIAYWYLSTLGAIMMLIYSIHILDPVFIVSSFLTLFIYIRNIFLSKNTKMET